MVTCYETNKVYIGRINRCCLGKIISVDGFEF